MTVTNIDTGQYTSSITWSGTNEGSIYRVKVSRLNFSYNFNFSDPMTNVTLINDDIVIKFYLNSTLINSLTLTKNSNFQYGSDNHKWYLPAYKTVSFSTTFTETHATSTFYFRIIITKGNSNVRSVYSHGSVTWASIRNEYLDQKSGSQSIPAKLHYYIKYNVDGDLSSIASQTKWYNENLILTSSKPTKTNCNFWYWNTASDKTGTKYNPGATYSANAGVTLYAIWQNSYIISYDVNNGSGPISSQTKWEDVALKLTTTKPTRTNYIFQHWNTRSDGKGNSYAPGATYSTNAPATLYAIWKYDYKNPTITNLTAIRCDSSGNADDEGTYAKISFNYSYDKYTSTSNGSSTNSWKTQKIEYQAFDANSWTNAGIDWSSQDHSSSDNGKIITGAYSNIIINNNILNAEKNYNIKITFQDNSNSTITETTFISSTFFLLDFHHQGKGIGIGAAAAAEKLTIGIPSYFNKSINTYNEKVLFHTLFNRALSGSMSTQAENGTGIQFVDGNNLRLGEINIEKNDNTGTVNLNIGCFAGASNNEKSNLLTLGINNSGTTTVSFNSPTAWLNGLKSGVQTVSGVTNIFNQVKTQQWLAAGTSGTPPEVEITSAYLYIWGKVCQLLFFWHFTDTYTVAASGNCANFVLGTLKEPYRPWERMNFRGSYDSNTGPHYYVYNGGNITILSFDPIGTTRTISSSTSMVFTAIYLLKN